METTSYPDGTKVIGDFNGMYYECVNGAKSNAEKTLLLSLHERFVNATIQAAMMVERSGAVDETVEALGKQIVALMNEMKALHEVLTGRRVPAETVVLADDVVQKLFSDVRKINQFKSTDIAEKDVKMLIGDSYDRVINGVNSVFDDACKRNNITEFYAPEHGVYKV